MITIKRDYKRHTCTEDIPSILDPDLELYYVYNDHISIHNTIEVIHLEGMWRTIFQHE
jgi:hypothetical protein